MWHKLGIPCTYDACVFRAKNNADANEAGDFPVEVEPNIGAVLLLFRWLPNAGIWNCGMWGVYNLAKTDRSLLNPVSIAESTAP